jgi:hypothetical protein
MKTLIRYSLDLVLGSGKAMRPYQPVCTRRIADAGEHWCLIFMKSVGIGGMGDVRLWAACSTAGLMIVCADTQWLFLALG